MHVYIGTRCPEKVDAQNHITIIHCVQKKHPLIFSIITPAFLGRFIYFLYQWKEEWIPYNLDTYSLDHVTKVYFIELLLNIKYIELWNLNWVLKIKTCEKPVKMWKVFCQKTVKNFVQKIKKMNIRRLSANNRFDRTHSRSGRSRSSQNALFLHQVVWRQIMLIDLMDELNYLN